MSKKSRRESLRESLSEAVRPHEPSPKLDEILGRYAAATPILSQSPTAQSEEMAHDANISAPASIPPSTGTSTRTRSPSTPPRVGAATESPSPGEVAPRRDFHKVANSITRQALPAGMFSGKSKQLYDCLYALSRGAVVPSMTVRVAKADLMDRADIGSKVTLDQNIRRLEAVGLISVETIGGIQGGNQYTVYLPEEIATPSSTGTSTPPSTGTRGATPPSPPSRGLNLDPLAPLETTPPSTGLSADSSTASGGPKTSFKTEGEKLDDEAFADLVALLKQSAEEVTGKGTGPADRERWREVAELLVTELKVAAARTTVSSAPAFLAEHLRRRLRKADSRQIEREVTEAAAASAAPSSSPRPELTREQIEEQAQLLAGLMQGGATIAELEEQFAGNFRPAQWHMIRSIALARRGSGRPAPPAGDSEAPAGDVLDS